MTGSTPIEGKKGAGTEVLQGPAPIESDVRICRLTYGISMHAWLCRACRALRKAAGWTVDLTKTTILHPIDCDDCDFQRQTERS